MAASRVNSERIEDVMNKRQNIRNMCVIAHVDHGKSTLTDALVSRAGLIPESQSGQKRFTDNNEIEIERGITIKSTAVSMFFDMSKNERVLGDLKQQRDGDGFLVNLIDCPGHVDFSSEVTAALRVSDGALVVVDVVSGCSAQTETVLRQALSERIKPVLIINKLDRAILEQKLEPEKLYQRLRQIIDQVNYLISVYSGIELDEHGDGGEQDVDEASQAEGTRGGVEGGSRSRSRSRSRPRPTTEQEETVVTAKASSQQEQQDKSSSSFKCSILNPVKGNVAFGCGKEGWAFTLNQFADIYSKKTGVPRTTLVKRLWDENYFNPSTKKWQTSSSCDADDKLQRGFIQYVLDPIYKTLNMCLDSQHDELDKLCTKLDIKLKLKAEERESMSGKELMRHFMKKWLPAADAMLELIVGHLPSPVQSQRYRVECLYEGPLDDQTAMGIRECDPNAGLMIYISKMFPDPVDTSKFFAFGRVFSGTAEVGQKVRIMGPGYKVGSDNELYFKNLSRCVCMIGDQPLSFNRVPCGNLMAISGLDKLSFKSGTITTDEKAHTIKAMKFTVSPVVRVAVDPVNPSDLPKFIEGLKRLARYDQLIQCDVEKGQHVISGAGELHLEICLRDLENVYAKVPIKTSDPIIRYKETVTMPSSQVCLAKTSNKLNRLFLTAEPLSEAFCTDIDDKKITLNQDPKERAKYLQQAHNFDVTEAKKIWCFGPNQFDSNILVDKCKGVASSSDVTDTICAGFQWGAEEGVLCQENMRGVRFNLEDLVYHSDPAHRKGAQILPAVRRAMMASQLTAGPALYEPVYLVEVQCPDNVVGAVYTLLGRKRGQIFDEYPIPGTLLVNLKAYLPVNESSGFTEELRGVTSGKAFPQCSFHHWQVLPGDPFDPLTKAGQVVKQIRQVKNLRDKMPELNDFLDKL